MRATSLALSLALLLAGCGLDSDPTGPGADVPLPEPALDPVDPEITAAAVTNSWATKAPIPTARWLPAAGMVKGLLYVAGGYGQTALRSVQAYNPGTNSWTTRAPLPAARTDGNGGVVINGLLYIAGGSDSLLKEVSTLF